MTKIISGLLLLTFILIHRFPSSISAQSTVTFYISPTGNDANSGTIDHPFATVERAQQQIRSQNRNSTGDITVNFRGGTYFISKTIRFTPQDSGFNGYKIIYQSFPGETAILTGGLRINEWSPHETKTGLTVWKSTIPVNPNTGSPYYSRQLYVDSMRAPRARSNDKSDLTTNFVKKFVRHQDVTVTANGTYIKPCVIQNGTSQAPEMNHYYSAPDSRMAAWGNPKDIEIIRQRMWNQHRCMVESISGSTVTMEPNCFHNELVPAQNPAVSLPDSIENAYELIDHANEWYINRTEGVLYLALPAGENPSSKVIILPVLDTFLAATGESANSTVSNLTFRNLTFQFGTSLFPNQNKGLTSWQADIYFRNSCFDWSQESISQTIVDYPGSFNFERSNSISILTNRFLNMGGTVLRFNRGSSNITVTGNQFFDISGTGISIGTHSLDPSLVPAIDMDRDITISNNILQSTGQEFLSSVAMHITNTRNLVIAHNQIFETPYSGVSVLSGLWWWETPRINQNIRISENDISHTVLKLEDGGSIYTNGQSNPGTIPVYSTIIENNILRNQGYGYNRSDPNDHRGVFGAVYLDDKSRYVEVKNNVAINNRMALLYKGGSHSIHDNYFQYNPAGNWMNGTDPFILTEGAGGICDQTSLPCGPITFSNNYSLADSTGSNLTSQQQSSMQSIITGAGLETGYRKIMAPIIQSPGTTVLSGPQIITWSAVPGAKNYLLRINNLSDPWTCNGEIKGKDVCITVPATTTKYAYDFTNGTQYTIWIHTEYGPDGQLSDGNLLNTRGIFNPEAELNSSFESDRLWIKHVEGAYLQNVEFVIGTQHSGVRSAHIKPNTPGSPGYYQPYTFTANTAYTWSAWVKSTSNTSRSTIAVYAPPGTMPHSGTSITTDSTGWGYVHNYGLPLGTAQWSPVCMQFTTGSQGGQGRLYAAINATGSSGDLWFDDVMLVANGVCPESLPTITPTPNRKGGDANGDNRVDGLDYVVWLNHYGGTATGITNGDFNTDNKVDGLDYVVWLNNYGR